MSKRKVSLQTMFFRQRQYEAEKLACVRDSARDSEGRMVMRLHILRGGFFTASAGAEGGQCAMDATVWSKMSDDILWRVLVLLPAAKRFQFQSVSRKWRQLLTSANFYDCCAAAAPRKSEERVVACVTPGADGGSNKSKLKGLDIDLSFVPSWFWTSDYFQVMAAADGLVCISNDSVHQHWGERRDEPWVDQYCVLNPLTRTCIVLPPAPFKPHRWLPPTTEAVTIYGYNLDEGVDKEIWGVATCELATGGAGSWVSAAFKSADPKLRGPLSLSLAQCAGEIYWYWNCRMHVLVPGPNCKLVDAAPPVDAPSVELLGLDAASLGFSDSSQYLVGHRGTVFFVTHLVKPNYTAPIDRPCGVWRLARDRMAWEAVSLLDAQEVERVTEVNHLEELDEREVEVFTRSGCVKGGDVCVAAAHAVLDLVCCQVKVTKKFKIPGRDPVWFMLGFNLNTGEWEQVHDDQVLLDQVFYTRVGGNGMELNPNLLLS